MEIVPVTSPVPWRVLTESAYGNKAIFMTVGPEHSGKTVEVAYLVKRVEKGPYPVDNCRRLTLLESVGLTDRVAQQHWPTRC